MFNALTMTTEEQRKEKEQYDTRTFPEIYSSLNHLQQMDLRDEIISRTGVTRVTVFNWAKGDRVPQYKGIRNIVSDCVKKITGIRSPQHILFDIKK